MCATHLYIKDLLKVKTLEEIAAQASVKKSRLTKYLQEPTIYAIREEFNRVLNLWIMAFCLRNKTKELINAYQ